MQGVEMEEGNTPTRRAPEGAAGWERDAVTYRLTPKRKSALLALLGDAQASPTDALDAAIERANAAKLDEGREGPDAAVARTLGELHGQIRALVAAAEEWTGVREKLALIAADCAEMRHAIAAAATLTDGVAVDAAFEPIAVWLGRADPELQWMVCKLRWLGKRPTGAGMALWDVELRELSRAGAAGPSKGDTFRVALGPALAAGPFARLDGVEAAVLFCSRSDRGWTLSLRSALKDGKLGEPFAELSI
jgi:hypothetical protein